MSASDVVEGRAGGMKEGERLSRSRLTGRDRQLIAFVGIARHLTTEQIARLFFPERHPETIRKRLAAWSGGRVGEYLRRLHYRTFDGELVTVWGLTPLGYLVAEQTLGRKTAAPRAEVSAGFLEHAVAVNDLLVGWRRRPWTASLSASGRRRPVRAS